MSLEWLKICLCKLIFWEKDVLHNEHQWGFTPVWVIRWRFKLDFRDLLHIEHERDFLLQIEQQQGLSSVWVSTCLFRSLFCENDVLHTEQLVFLSWVNDNFSLQWVKTCFCKQAFWVNDLLHNEHQWGFTPVWIIRWRFKLDFRENDLLHIEHEWVFLLQIEQQQGLSSVWVPTCLIRSLFSENDVLHTEQKKPFWSRWQLRRWLVKWAFCENDLLQMEHVKGFSPVCNLIWIFALDCLENCLLQIKHKNGFFFPPIFLNNSWPTRKTLFFTGNLSFPFVPSFRVDSSFSVIFSGFLQKNSQSISVRNRAN